MHTSKRQFRGHAFTFVFVVLGAVAVFLYLLNLSGSSVNPLSSSYTVKAVVPEAGSLVQGSTVTMAGVDVGQVETVARDGLGAIATVKITDRKLTPLPADSLADLEVRTPLGENYIQIVPGKSTAKIQSGGTIQMDQSENYTDVDTLLSTLQNGTRAKAQEMIEALGGAIGGQGGNLHATLSQTGTLLHDGSAITATLVNERQTIAQLVSQVGDIGGAIGERDASIQTIATQGLSALQAIGSRDDKLRQIIDDLPSTLNQVKSTTKQLETTSDNAAPVVANLATAVSDLKPTVQDLVPAAKEGQSVVKNLGRAVTPLNGTLNALTKAGTPLKSALPKVKKVLCNVNPMLRYLDPYKRDLVAFVTGLGHSADRYDTIGHTIMLEPVLNESSAVGLPQNVTTALNQLVHSGIVSETLSLTYNPYPKPNEANGSFTGGDSISGPAALKASGYKYPHVTADC